MDDIVLNNETKKILFSDFIEEYKTKGLKEKQQFVINDLKEMIACIQQLCYLKGIKTDLLINKEILDVNSPSYTEDDFAEAVYVYIQMFKEVISDFLDPIMGDNETLEV